MLPFNTVLILDCLAFSPFSVESESEMNMNSHFLKLRKVLHQYIVGAMQYIVNIRWFDFVPNFSTDILLHNQKYVMLCSALAKIHRYKFLNQAE